MARKPKRPKSVKVMLIADPYQSDSKVDQSHPYAVLKEMRRAHHGHLDRAKIAMAWRLDVKPNKDGFVELGKCKKGSDLDRELHHFDFVIMLNKIFWDRFSTAQKRALVDHELCHAQVSVDSEGEVVRDERNREVYRIRRHDIEEFRDVVARHGFYKADLVEFAKVVSLQLERNAPLFDGIPANGDGASERPFGTVRQEAGPGTNGHAPKTDAWKDAKLADVLALPAAIHQSMADAQLRTMGQLAEFTVRNRLTDIPGIGEVKASKIEDALEKFWAAQVA